MRVAYIITRGDDIGGAQVHVRDLSEALLARGHEVIVLAGGEGEFFKELAVRRIPYHSVPHLSTAINPALDGPALLEIVRILKKFRPDIVSAHTAKAGFLGRIASGILRIPAIFTPHGWAISDRVSPLRAPIFRCAEVIAGLISRRIINVCEFEMRLALKHRIAHASKLAKVYNGISDVSEDSLALTSRQPPTIVMIARCAEPKEHSVLLKALSGLKQLPWDLEFIGNGPFEEKIRREAASLRITERIRLLGFCKDVVANLARAQIFALISRFEAFPYSVLEAMRAGLPVVASDVGGIPEAVLSGKTGLLSPAGQPDILREHLAMLISDAALRKRLGDNGRARYLAHFTFEEMIANTLLIYEQALSNDSARVFPTRRKLRDAGQLQRRTN